MRTWSRKSPKAPLSTSTAGPFDDAILGRAIALLLVLLVATAVVWTMALTRSSEVHEITACNPPPRLTTGEQPRLGEQVPRSAMTNVTPAKLAETKIHVLNASGRGGQAADVADALRDLGFAQPSAANDPVYANGPAELPGADPVR
ncbi:hypothetical protein MYXE_31170 [Mycobacterium xenopi]|uniref:LytR/CpsA/Psr regulator C-terminal domain-containing protein n=1 Tax=Mycobacterium xenopi TaxID=1789 RepID=A0AAD1H2T7_MYCXE|nr:hypothetical protein MYXE_31170 [Mycobacterium xenopi]